MPDIVLGGLEIHFRDEGQGFPVLLLHGSFCTGASFAPLARMLAAGYRVLVPDLPGHGTSRPASPFWTTPRLARDMLAFLDALGIGQVHAAGHSMGGDVAMSLGVLAPTRCRSLVSIGSAGVPNEPARTFFADLDPDRGGLERHPRFFARLKEEHRAAPGGWRALFQTTRANCLAWPDFSDADLRRLAMPFLLLAGSRDGFVLPHETARLRALCPRFALKTVDGAGHAPHMEPAFLGEAAQAMLDFFDRT
jgi:pimeloyl-ACP methyl ester carboxylesterase